MATAQVVRTDVSGTSFVVDVTALELNSSLSTLDFEATHNGSVVSGSYAKTSVTQLTYTGSSVTLGTRVIIRRTTSITAAETTFISTTTASALTNALDKERLRLEELDNRITYVLGQLVAGGISVGTIPISSVAFGVAWNGDNTNAPARAAVYNKAIAQDAAIALKADSLNAALTGVPVAPTAANTVATTQIATSAFVANRAASRLAFISTNQPSFAATTGTPASFTTLTGTTRASFGDSFTTGVFTVGQTGVYTLNMVVSYSNTLTSSTSEIFAIAYINGIDIIIQRSAPAISGVAALAPSITRSFTAGDTIAFRALAVFSTGVETIQLLNASIIQVS